MPEDLLSERRELISSAAEATRACARGIAARFPHHGEAILRQLDGGRTSLDAWNRVKQVAAALMCVPGEALASGDHAVRWPAVPLGMLAQACARLFWELSPATVQAVHDAMSDIAFATGRMLPAKEGV